MSAITDRIKEARERAGMSQAVLAQALGLSSGAVGRWEAGYANPDIERLPDIARVLRVPVEWLIVGGIKTSSKDSLTFEHAFNPREAPLMHELPVVNKIAADHNPTFAECKETALVDVRFSKKNHYCLQVKGRSMYPTIMEGDIVIVRSMYMQLEAYDSLRGPANKKAWAQLHHCVVAAIVDGEDPVLKRLFVQEAKRKETGWIMYLRGDNPAAPQIMIDRETELKVVGEVVQIMRDPKNFDRGLL